MKAHTVMIAVSHSLRDAGRSSPTRAGRLRACRDAHGGLFLRTTSATTRWRDPAVPSRPVLNKPCICAEPITGEKLGAGIAPELARSERRVVCFGQQILIAVVVLRPPGERR